MAGNGPFSAPVPNDVAAVLRQHKQGIDELTGLIRQVQSERDNAQDELRRLRGQIETLRGDIDKSKSSPVRPTSIDDIPGVRLPQWYVVEVPFVVGDTRILFGTVEINPEGPFIITQVQAYWQCNDDGTNTGVAAFQGRVLPVSALQILDNQLGSAALAAIVPLIAQVPELSFQIEISGSGRFWTNQKIYGPSFYGLSNPLYTGQMGWVDPTDRIKVHVTPELTIPHNGRAIMVFHGFQILRDVRMSQILGSAS